jgi:predicted metal-dependent HD superfamily phosphohydrolase
MAVVGRPVAGYREYTAQIRQEYARFTDAEYRQGRINLFLKPVLARESIFRTAAFRRRFEEQAQQNLRQELRELERVP